MRLGYLKCCLFISHFIKIVQLIQTLDGARTHTHTHTQQGYLISTIFS